MVSSHQLLKEMFCCRNIAFCREHEFNGLPFLVHGAVEMLT